MPVDDGNAPTLTNAILELAEATREGVAARKQSAALGGPASAQALDAVAPLLGAMIRVGKDVAQQGNRNLQQYGGYSAGPLAETHRGLRRPR